MNQGHTYEERIGPGAAGRRLIDHLAERYRHSTEGEWRERIAEGLVTLDGHPAEPGTILQPEMVLAWHRPPWEEPETPLAFEVLHEDAHLLAVDKPSGLPTLPGGGFLEHTLLYQVRRPFPEASPVHRLGRGTSGVVLFARNPETGAALSEAWRSGKVVKTYRALASGIIERDRLENDVPIGPLPHALLGTLHGAHPEGKPAQSDVSVIERRGDTTLVEVAIATGRPHQIRIHLAASGHPLAGDPLYRMGGDFDPKTDALPGDLGYALHAWRIGFGHPASGDPLEIEAPLPSPLRRSTDSGSC